MTNKTKLPEVGSRYRDKTTLQIVKIYYIVERNGEDTIEVDVGDREVMPFYNLRQFWEIYEEIPGQEPVTRENRTTDKVRKAKERMEQSLVMKDGLFYDGILELKLFKGFCDDVQNLINALDSQDVNDIDDPVDIEEEKKTVESKSIWKPVLIHNPQLIKGTQHVIIQMVNTGSEYATYVDQGSLCGFMDLSNNPIQQRYIQEYCTLNDFINQVQDNTDRLDKLETKLNK
tara:strand:+ start:8313 stop:9002 length:690 start_codon:yes stop_codon:yes gene_type:complete